MSDNTADPLAAARDAIVLAALSNAPFDGWSKKTLAKATADAGLDPTMAERAFPGGPVDAVLHFAALADRKLEDEAAAKAEELAAMRFTPRVGWLIRRRIEAWAEHREAVRRAMATLALPSHAGQTMRAAWRTADTIWHAAGDQSTDFSYYTKRATLIAVYSATLLCWLDDNSEGATATWEFLDRRLADVGKFSKFRQETETKLKKLPNPVRAAKRARDKLRPLKKGGLAGK
jgi:ubiquinone biosynthesis protein COQ9